MSKPTKRSVSEPLTKKRLGEIARRLELDIPARTAKQGFVDRLTRSRQVDLEDVLTLLKRDELKAACEEHGLDSSGRSKDPLVDRLLGREAPSPKPKKPKKRAGKKKAPASQAAADETAPTGLKARLRRFALWVPGGYRGRDAGVDFVRDLLGCFEWNDDYEGSLESPSVIKIVEHGGKVERKVAALWHQRKVMIEVVAREETLDTVWREVLKVAIQAPTVPQYILLTNLRDFHLYDLARDKERPRLSVGLDELPKYSEAFPFLERHWVPGTVPQIINVDRVSREVADLVARLFRSLKAQHSNRESEVIRFTLQCIITMFAEDIGLLPQECFTNLLYEAAETGDAEAPIKELFQLMSTPMEAGREIPYFNGGLFSDPVTLPLGSAQLRALTKAAEADWTYVDPHIFGSVFQGIMDDAERHASGAHYTAREDIMRVVGPTILDPWRRRIESADTLSKLRELRKQLASFRVLDPACGSGNFLYVSFRELYRLETEILVLMYDYPAVSNDPKNRPSWGSGIPTTNFFGIDTNPFAVELAKTTLNIAKKVAFDERRGVAAAKMGQLEMELDPSLPLDNLDENILCDDALFRDWPEADAIVGNPPFLGGTKIREELGDEYVARLREAFPDVHGKADLCALWFRRTDEHLPSGGRAGLVGTQSIRLANTREASLDYILDRGGTIVDAVSSIPWPGAAVVEVSMVNWVRGIAPGPYRLVVDGVTYSLPTISSHLQLHTDVSPAGPIAANRAGSSQGVHIGTKAAQIDQAKAQDLWRDRAARPFIRPVAQGKHLLGGKLATTPDWIVDMSSCSTIAEAEQGGAAFEFLTGVKLPEVRAKAASFGGWLERYWQAWRPRASFFAVAEGNRRLLVCSKHAARPVFVFISPEFLPTDSLQMFALDDDYSFGILQSSLHWRWACAKGSKLKTDTRYTMEVWKTFPWPQSASIADVAAVADQAKSFRRVRNALMQEHSLSLRAVHKAADTPAHPLTKAQRDLDESVRAAYDIPPAQDLMQFLLELNLCVREDEADGIKVVGPGLPPEAAPGDPRWTSTDFLVPPSLVD